MAANNTADDNTHRVSGMEKILLERERLDKVLKERFRKEVTVLFSDVCGYTQYTEKEGDIQSRTMLLRHNRILMPAIEKHTGKIMQVVGDGVMAAFDDPVNAGKAAIEVQQKLRAYNDQAEKEDQIYVKIGINCGSVLLDEDAAYQNLTGDVANVAARIQSEAQKDQILISKSVYEHLRNNEGFRIHFHTMAQVKGKSKALSLYRLIWCDDEQTISPPANDRRQADLSSQSKQNTTIINLDFNIEGNQLKISANEAQSDEKSTISRYETISVSLSGVDTYCQRLVDSLNKANRQGRLTGQMLLKLREIGQILYDELLTLNIKKILRQTKADTLIINVDDQLVHIPWELLYDGQQFLCLRFSMGRVVKTRQSIASPIKRPLGPPINMLILADPTGDLKGAHAEGIQIREFMDQTPELVHLTLNSINATVDSVKRQIRNFDIIHFAGHSDYDVNCPEAGGWRLQKGSLCTGDIIKMAGGAAMPRMIFANACQSARTEQWALQTSFETKIFGMANAFLVAGVKHYIGTFWEIPDESSSRFAIEFYKYLLSDFSVGEAIRAARKKLIETFGEEAIVWASYVLYGDPTFEYLVQPRDQSAPDQVIGKSDPARSIRKLRTREEVIDFSEGRKPKQSSRWWHIALIILIATGIWFYGWPLYVNRGAEKKERQAMADYLSGKFDSALDICQQLQEKIPDRPVACLILGNISLARGDKTTAQSYFRAVIDAETESNQIKSEAFMGLARIASLQQQPQKALQHYQQAAIINPNSARPLSSQAVVLESQNRDEEALQLYRQILEKFPKDRGSQLAAQDISERLSWQQDQEKQTRIDQLVQALLEKDRSNTAQVAYEDRWTSKPLSVWLMEFEEMGFSLQEGQGRIVHILIRDLLTKHERVKMVERAVLDKLLAELHLGASQLADRQTALSIGRLMATRVLLPAQIQYLDGQTLVSIRAIESETGLISASIVGTYNSAQAPVEIAKDMSERIVAELITSFPLRCKVLEIKGEEILLDIGEDVGLQNKLYFKGIDSDVIVQITSVDSHHSMAKIIQGANSIVPGLRLEEERLDLS